MRRLDTWRDHAAPIIARVIQEHGSDPEALKKALFDAYPFGERRYWPYKVWLSEIKRQLHQNTGPKVDPNQMTLAGLEKECLSSHDS